MVKVQNFKGQIYEKLRRECIASKEAYKDPLFPPEEKSLGLTGNKAIYGSAQWKRVMEICPDPVLFNETSKCRQMSQGNIGNASFLSAASAIASVKELWNTTIPDHKSQDWGNAETEKAHPHPGIFHFRFWRCGHWIDVVVDDMLPTVDNKLITSQSTSGTGNELWVALLEKAYAKFCGTYGDLENNTLYDTLVDFTSGFSEVIDLEGSGYKGVDEGKISHLKNQLNRTHDERGMMCCSISTKTDPPNSESMTKAGLVKGHEYIITAIKEINLDAASNPSAINAAEKVLLLRLRNPWGSKLWNGPYSEGSLEWTRMEESTRQKLGLIFEDDSEFWMPVEDFISEFSDLTLCHIVGTGFFQWIKGPQWHGTLVLGGWTRPHHAGGSPTQETFLKNPQYSFDVHKDDGELIVQLVQQEQKDYTRVGFHIMKVEENRVYRLHKIMKKEVTSDYVKGRSALWRGHFKKGRYVIVPTTFDSQISAEFMLRVHAEEPLKLTELTADHPEPCKWMCMTFTNPATAVTQITVEGAIGLAQSDNTFCIIKVEGQTVKSDIIYNSTEPKWNLQCVFFRKDICKPIFVELWGVNPQSQNIFLGCAILSGESDNQVVSVKKSLVGRGNKRSDKHPGTVNLLIATYDNLDAT